MIPSTKPLGPPTFPAVPKPLINEVSSTKPNSTIKGFTGINKYTNSTIDFLESSSLAAKVAFLILVLIGFVFLLRLGIYIITYFIVPSNPKKLLDGMWSANQFKLVPQDPSQAGSITIDRSVNASQGIEFTWSCWLNINDISNYNPNVYKCIFYKGNDFTSGEGQDTSQNPDMSNTPLAKIVSPDNIVGLNFPNNAPGVYITPNINNILILMNTYNMINEAILIDDIPLNKWINVIIRCQNTTLDVYINGTITKSHQLHGVPKQNYGDVFVAPNGGFDGFISNLWYYNYALGLDEINNLVQKGPNTNLIGSSNNKKIPTNYLSLRWFFNDSIPDHANM
jgi:hypothetical protein